jgi:hypothetical protein
MKRILFIALFLLVTKAGFAQNEKDSIVNSMPMVNDRLIYADSIQTKGRDKMTSDTILKKWFNGYFKMYCPDTLSKDKDVNSSILEQAATEFRMTTTSVALVKYDFYLVMTIKINCYNGYYTYKIFDIFFIPKSRVFRTVGYYQASPEYLIGLLNKKHLGLVDGMNMGGKKIREYLTHTNDGVQACIASLNKAMAN